MKILFSWLLVAVLISASRAQAEDSLFIEEMTWPEVNAAIKSGKKNAIIYAGSTEQNGPHMVLGKHNFMARSLAEMIARDLGNALVYPVLPFAPTGDVVAHSGHMHFAGSVSMSEETYGAVIRDVARSAAAAGFSNILIMGDHGDGQKRLAAIAKELDAGKQSGGARVFYVGAVYAQAEGGHADRKDTSMLMAIDPGSRWVRKELMGPAAPANGADASPEGASAEEGRRLIRIRVCAAMREIYMLTAGELSSRAPQACVPE